MAETVKTIPDGVNLPLASLEQTFTGNPIETITVEYPPNSGKTYTQTFTYTGGVITNITGWVLDE